MTPGRVLFDDEALEAGLPGEEGVFSIWDFHQDGVCALARGEVVLRRKGLSGRPDIREAFPIVYGVARVKDGALVVMAEEITPAGKK